MVRIARPLAWLSSTHGQGQNRGIRSHSAVDARDGSRLNSVLMASAPVLRRLYRRLTSPGKSHSTQHRNAPIRTRRAPGETLESLARAFKRSVQRVHQLVHRRQHDVYGAAPVIGRGWFALVDTGASLPQRCPPEDSRRPFGQAQGCTPARRASQPLSVISARVLWMRILSRLACLRPPLGARSRH